MASKFITDEGKKKLLKLGFLGDTNNFNYMALSKGKASITGEQEDFDEVTGKGNYQRVEIVSDDVAGLSNAEKSISISGTFDGSNYNLSDGGLVTEIGIVDSVKHDSSQTFFAFIQVPQIEKTDNITLKYTVIISLL